jgi:hypothetical protein
MILKIKYYAYAIINKIFYKKNKNKDRFTY